MVPVSVTPGESPEGNAIHLSYSREVPDYFEQMERLVRENLNQ